MNITPIITIITGDLTRPITALSDMTGDTGTAMGRSMNTGGIITDRRKGRFMSTQTLSRTRSLSIPFAVREKGRHHNPFLDALTHIEYGRMTLIDPDGNGLEFSGPEKGPRAFLRLHDWGALDELVARGEIGFAEAYIDGRWDTNDLPALLTFGLVNSESLERFFHGRPWYALLSHVRSLLHGNSLRGSKRNVMAHYDLGNDFYALWLDDSMTYSCALFEGDEDRSLEAAQAAKYRRILEKISATPGDHILEIGCGWGGFAEEAAHYGLKVTGVTLSREQATYARERLYCAGLQHLASIELADYREVTGQFDHIVSIGMFEHVGEPYWPVYFDTVKKHLKPGGNALVQSITLDDYLFESLHDCNGFIEQVIFPGGMLPSKSRFYEEIARAGLECRRMSTFGQDYVRTLRHWLSRFEERKTEVKGLGYDEKFLRLWRFYLASCIASFISHRTDVMQAELVHAA